MRFLADKRNLKIISLILVIITITNLIIPICSYADEDEEVGGLLFQPIFKFFAGIGDLVIKALQAMFMGDGDIKSEGISELKQEGTFLIRYSPGIIFSNKVPGLDANFINPSVDDLEAEKVTGSWEKIGDYNIENAELVTEYGFDKDKAELKTTRTLGDGWEFDEYHIMYTWKYNNITYELINTEVDWSTALDSTYESLENLLKTDLGGFLLKWSQMVMEFVDSIAGTEWNLYQLNQGHEKNGLKIESTAKQLQGTISKWYKALRLVALVGLMSVLVYVGIRIIISSTGQEKAKYKKMLGDWLAAVCILFVLQYIMAFTMEIVEKIIGIFESNFIGPDGEDILMTTFRQNIGDTNSYSSVFTSLIIYLVLVIYTVVFTIQYLKRLIYLAFFTMIAPLIALTYPLDKIKDRTGTSIFNVVKRICV